MKPKKKLLNSITILSLILSAAGCNFSYSQQTQKEAYLPAEQLEFKLQDLISDTKSVYPAFSSNPYIKAVCSSDGKCTATINLRPDGYTPYEKAEFIIFPSGTIRYGWEVNIGDSVSNNGNSGDRGDQSNDAELQIHNGNLTLYAGDKGSGAALLRKANWWTGQVMHFLVENGKLTFWRNSELREVISDNALFALKGQLDSEGSVNYTLYAAFNRVIDGEYRAGSGIGDVYIILSSPAPVAFFGHLHNHSNDSDGTGDPETAFPAAQAAGLDFMGLSDHCTYLDNTKWNKVKSIADNYNEAHKGEFVAFHGFEWSPDVWSHILVVNSDTFCQAVINTAGIEYIPTFTDFINWLKDYKRSDAIAFINHPGRQNPESELDQFMPHSAYTPTNRIVGMELWNKADGFSAYYYKNYYQNTSSIRDNFFNTANLNGWHIGAAGSEDNHNGTWGTSVNGTAANYRLAVLATRKTKEALWNSLVARQFYSTLDKNLFLWFDADGSPMGSFLRSGHYVLTIKARDPDSDIFTAVELYKNGALYKPDGNDGNLLLCPADYVYLEIPVFTVKNDYFYVKITEAATTAGTDPDEAISSPIFFLC